MLRKALVVLTSLIVIPILGGYCGLQGMFAGPEDYNRHYFANDLICGIDESVREELDHKLPSGYLGRKYSPELWMEHWNERVTTLSRGDLHQEFEGYVGPTGEQLVLYALGQRRERKLPDVLPTSETRPLLQWLYAKLEQAQQGSCAYLGGASPQCSLSPAQYPNPEQD